MTYTQLKNNLLNLRSEYSDLSIWYNSLYLRDAKNLLTAVENAPDTNATIPASLETKYNSFMLLAASHIENYNKYCRDINYRHIYELTDRDEDEVARLVTGKDSTILSALINRYTDEKAISRMNIKLGRFIRNLVGISGNIDELKVDIIRPEDLLSKLPYPNSPLIKYMKAVLYSGIMREVQGLQIDNTIIYSMIDKAKKSLENNLMDTPVSKLLKRIDPITLDDLLGNCNIEMVLYAIIPDFNTLKPSEYENYWPFKKSSVLKEIYINIEKYRVTRNSLLKSFLFGQPNVFNRITISEALSMTLLLKVIEQLQEFTAENLVGEKEEYLEVREELGQEEEVVLRSDEEEEIVALADKEEEQITLADSEEEEQITLADSEEEEQITLADSGEEEITTFRDYADDDIIDLGYSNHNHTGG